ncbi:MAG: thiamine phosphate synthase [Chloroflexi bacterium]|nr:thiamine phosphate synthase [Chloroflexota bacterium]
MPREIAATRLHLVTDRSLCTETSLEDTVARAVEGGVEVVHLREKDLPPKELYQLAARLRKVTLGRALLIINDRIDIALAISADGVHLPGDSVPTYVAKKLGADRLIVGRSVHSVEEALESEAEEADYVILGTIYKTASHPGLKPAGLGLVREVKAAVGLPVYAIGGIDASNAAEVMAAGADGIAVIRAILGAKDPRAAAQGLLEVVKGSISPNR